MIAPWLWRFRLFGLLPLLVGHSKGFLGRSATTRRSCCAFQPVAVSSQTTPSIGKNATVYPPVSLPFRAGLGYLWHSARGRPHKYQERLRQKYGNSYMIWNKYVVISDPDDIQDVLETHNLPKFPDIVRGYRALFGSDGGILAAPWREWQIQRRRLSPPFSLPAVRNLSISGKMEACTEPFLRVLDRVADSHRSLEMDSLFQDVTMDIIGAIVLDRSFGLCRQRLNDTKTVPSNPFRESIKILLPESLRHMTLPPDALKRRPKFLLQKVQRARRMMDEFLEDCIQTREMEGNANRTEKDLLQILLQAESDGEITREQVKTQLHTMLFAGHETTAHTLSYMLWEISQNSTLQDLLAQEATTLLPTVHDTMAILQHNDSIQAASSLPDRLPWLDRTFSETLRKHPVTPTGIGRLVDRDTPIVVGRGLEIPPGTCVSIPSWSLHRNEQYWPNPQRFDPSRFVDTSSQHPHALQSFSAGPRNCLGSRLARIEVLHIMAPLLRRFVVTCEETQEPDDFVTLTRRPRHGISFQFRRRN